mgnify:CR=1 FL=1
MDVLKTELPSTWRESPFFQRETKEQCVAVRKRRGAIFTPRHFPSIVTIAPNPRPSGSGGGAEFQARALNAMRGANVIAASVHGCRFILRSVVGRAARVPGNKD